METYCRGEAAGKFGTRPQYVHLNDVHPKNDKYIAKGTADLGRDGQRSFKCVFDQQGNFLRLKVTN